MKNFIFSCLFILICASSVLAQPICPLNNATTKPKEVQSFENFKRMAVLENGRIKPLDTYARNVLLRFSGRRTYDKQEAIQWLARLLFAPKVAKEDKIFLIDNPVIPEALGVEVHKKRRYSYVDLEPALPRLFELAGAAQRIEEKERGIIETELIRVYKNLELYANLSLSFSFVFPHPAFTISEPQNLQALELPSNAGQFSFIDIAARAQKLEAMTAPLSGAPPDQWDKSQQEIVQVVSSLYQWSSAYRQLPLHIVPSYMPNDVLWYSPWDAMALAMQSSEGRAELFALRDVVVAYWRDEQIDFDVLTKVFSSSVQKRSGSKAFRKINLELLLNKINPFFWAKIFYFLAFIVFLVSFLNDKSWTRYVGCGLIVLGFIPHLAAIIMRCVILQRPPVSNLYETFIFVGFVSVLAGLIIEAGARNWIGIVISSISGFVFLMIAGKFSLEGDTLQMLVAVLNSNFWLATHVVSITIGYAGVCVAGIIGHIYILQAIFKPKDKALLDSTHKILLGALGFGLTMAFLGTNLGGIWADQSWGRFWGWDPKENGALLIVIWVAILFHAKIARIIGPLGLAVGSILGIIVVMWAWFGVNLLSVGLHSYGFTSGLAMNLTMYVLVQILFICVTMPIASSQLKRKS